MATVTQRLKVIFFVRATVSLWYLVVHVCRCLYPARRLAVCAERMFAKVPEPYLLPSAIIATLRRCPSSLVILSPR